MSRKREVRVNYQTVRVTCAIRAEEKAWVNAKQLSFSALLSRGIRLAQAEDGMVLAKSVLDEMAGTKEGPKNALQAANYADWLEAHPESASLPFAERWAAYQASKLQPAPPVPA